MSRQRALLQYAAFPACLSASFADAGKGPGAVKKGGGIKIAKRDEGKTRRFFWDPLFADEVQGTLFQVRFDPSLQSRREGVRFLPFLKTRFLLLLRVQKREAFAVNRDEVETAFAKVTAKAKTEVKKPKVRGIKSTFAFQNTSPARKISLSLSACMMPQLIQLLPDSKRAYNMNIALSRFNNYSFQELRDAIIDLNPKVEIEALSLNPKVPKDGALSSSSGWRAALGISDFDSRRDGEFVDFRSDSRGDYCAKGVY